MIDVAIIGMGNIGTVHGRVYRDNPRSKIVAVCDIVREKADKAAAELDAQAFYSVKDLLASGIQIDAVSITTCGKENGGDHYEPTMEVLEAGIPVLGEKPISNELDKAREMVALARNKSVPYGINLNHRFTPSARQARDWLDEGRMGALSMINMTMWINNPNESSEHFHIRALHPHSIDVMRYFAGDVEEVHAMFRKGPGRVCWSNLQANMLFSNGVLGHLTGSYDAGGSFGLETCELIGSEARVVIHEAAERLVFCPRSSTDVETYEHLGGMSSFGETFASRIEAWLADLEAGTPPDQIDGKAEDALKAQTIIEACIRSWDERSAIKISEMR